MFSETFKVRYQWTLMALALVGPVLVAGDFLGAISVFFVQTRYQMPAVSFIILLAASCHFGSSICDFPLAGRLVHFV